MQNTVKIETLNPTQAKLKISVPAAKMTERVDTYFAELAKKAKVPGFRPGKAPKDVVKKMYQSDSQSDLTERLVSEFVFDAVEANKLELLFPPKLIATDLPDSGKEFNFEVEVDLKPTVPTLNLKGLEIEDADAKPVTDEEIASQIELMRDADATFADIIELRAARKDDCVVVKFEGSLDGVKSPEFCSDSQTFVLGKKQFLPEFETAVEGLKVGENRSFDLTFPENYHAEHLRQKTAKFTVELTGLKQKVLPELDDTFAKSANPDVQTLAELREKIRKELEAQKERMRTSTLRERVGDKLVELNPFEVNPRQVASLARHLAEEAHHLMHQMNVEHEENEDHFKALHESSMKKAQRDVQLSYLLQRLAKDQGFTVTPEDVQRRLKETSEKTGYSVSQIQAYYAGKDDDGALPRIERLKIDILDEKSLDYALAQATIKNKGSK